MRIKQALEKVLKKSRTPTKIRIDKAEDYCKDLEALYRGQIKIKDLTYLNKILFS